MSEDYGLQRPQDTPVASPRASEETPQETPESPAPRPTCARCPACNEIVSLPDMVSEQECFECNRERLLGKPQGKGEKGTLKNRWKGDRAKH